MTPLEIDNLPEHYIWGCSAEGIVTWSLQIIRRSPRCRCTQEPTDARSSFCFVRVGRHREEGGEGSSRIPPVFETHGTAFLCLLFRLTEPSTKANIVREVSVRHCGEEAGSFYIGDPQGEAVTTQECVLHFRDYPPEASDHSVAQRIHDTPIL